MRNLSSTSPGDPDGCFGVSASSTPEALQMSYCLVNEDEMDASIQRRPQPRSHISPSRSKPSPTLSHSNPKNPSQDGDAVVPAEPGSPRSSAGGNAFRRESTQTVRPVHSGLALPPTSTHRQASSVFTPSVPDGSVGISDISCSASRHNSPVASFSEYPLSRVTSFHANDGIIDAADRYPDHSEHELVMPVMTITHRRPFTETGKSIGGLKILVAGSKGAGKSSLIRAILQCCEHIVHVEPKKDVPGTRLNNSRHDTTEKLVPESQISEIHASTMPRPPWWTPCDEGSAESKDPTFVDTVLDPNICFVDTPGHENPTMLPQVISLAREYIESHLRPHLSSSVADSDMLRMLGGNGGSLVTGVLYLISPAGISKEDTTFLSALQQVTNVIPIVSHADTLSVEEVAAIKEAVAQELADNGVHPFTFSVSGTPDDTPPVYAVSSLPGAEFDLTDASLLVNSEYLQPLITTDLARLVDDIFCPDGASWLRHSAAKVYLQWRRRHSQFGYGMDLCLAPKVTTDGWPLTGGFPWGGRRSGEELLDDWAAALRRSLSNSASEARGTELLRLPRPSSLAVARTRHDRPRRSKGGCAPHQDPLGLLRILGGISNNGQAIVEVVGTVGVLGTFGMWMWKAGMPE
ncbi:uncharacterized protein DNG_05393 [Cephalotrichum gorgonifer]|uniref:Septin-type G domain-containing protein n=1 Tax=Cephalotrichum gorgonifer TaxID=2041049 RepID=A0AAE8MZU0_9PEZI|nr:uncharacterized protein DNG_05393 [Cephalotrichum gorgonifer]